MMGAAADAANDVSNASPSELGKIHFSMSYDFTKRSLIVEIHEAENLPAMDRSGTSDPYVKVRQIIRSISL